MPGGRPVSCPIPEPPATSAETLAAFIAFKIFWQSGVDLAQSLPMVATGLAPGTMAAPRRAALAGGGLVRAIPQLPPGYRHDRVHLRRRQRHIVFKLLRNCRVRGTLCHKQVAMSAHQDSPADVCQNSSFFEGLAPRDIRSILAAATPRRFLANSILYNQGEPARAAYLLVEGRARYFYVTPEGQKIVFIPIMPGELMGAAALVRSISSHNVSAEVLSHSRTLAWDKNTIRNLAARYPRLLDNALSITATYITWLISAHVGLACDSAQLRVAQILTNLANHAAGPAGSPRSSIELTVTNEELAHAASVTPFTVSRLMSKWQRSGFLTKSRGKVLLRSPEGLLRSNA